MARWNGYIRVERIVANLNAANFATLVDAMRGLGLQSDPIPANINHERPNVDEPPTMYIFQASFDPAEVEIAGFIQMMADLFGQDPEDVGSEFTDISYSGDGRETREWTFSFPSGVTDRVIVARFGRGGTHEDSRLETLGYLYDYAADWGEIIA